jgi:hypothetical protein
MEKMKMKMKTEKKTAGGLAKGRRCLVWVVALVVTGVVLTGCPEDLSGSAPVPYQPNVVAFSNKANETGSAIDMIAAAAKDGRESVIILLPSSHSEGVVFDVGNEEEDEVTDFGTAGLVLKYSPGPEDGDHRGIG